MWWRSPRRSASTGRITTSCSSVHGQHACLGVHPARAVICEAVRRLLLRPGVRLLPPPEGQVVRAGGSSPTGSSSGSAPKARNDDDGEARDDDREQDDGQGPSDGAQPRHRRRRQPAQVPGADPRPAVLGSRPVHPARTASPQRPADRPGDPRDAAPAGAAEHDGRLHLMGLADRPHLQRPAPAPARRPESGRPTPEDVPPTCSPAARP